MSAGSFLAGSFRMFTARSLETCLSRVPCAHAKGTVCSRFWLKWELQQVPLAPVPRTDLIPHGSFTTTAIRGLRKEERRQHSSTVGIFLREFFQGFFCATVSSLLTQDLQGLPISQGCGMINGLIQTHRSNNIMCYISLKHSP